MSCSGENSACTLSPHLQNEPAAKAEEATPSLKSDFLLRCHRDLRSQLYVSGARDDLDGVGSGGLLLDCSSVRGASSTSEQDKAKRGEHDNRPRNSATFATPFRTSNEGNSQSKGSQCCVKDRTRKSLRVPGRNRGHLHGQGGTYGARTRSDGWFRQRAGRCRGCSGDRARELHSRIPGPIHRRDRDDIAGLSAIRDCE